MKTVLEVNNVSKVFCDEKGKSFYAVKDVSFFLKEGESLGIVGESGCGKSTLIHMIAGLLPVTAGSIRLEGMEITDCGARERRKIYESLQMVFQDPYSAFSPRMTIGYFLGEGLRAMKKSPASAIEGKVRELLEMVELGPENAEKLPHQLSGGQLQRVVIARALSVNPKILLLDEATSALDVSVQRQILSLLADLYKMKRLSYLFIGHDLAVVRSITDRILVMYEGEIVEELESERLLEQAKHPYTRRLLASVYSLDRKKQVY